MNKFRLIILMGVTLIMSMNSCDDDLPGSANTQKPVANFSVVAEKMEADQKIEFTDASSDEDGFITGWNWDFGDGTTSTVQSPDHFFATGGTYQVKLIAMDNTGSASEAYAKTLVIADNPYANAKEPEIEWSFDLPGYLNRCSPAVADDGTVYIGFNQAIREDQGPDFYAIKDGSLVWEQVFLEGSANKSDQVRSSPSIADDGSVYIGSYYSRTLYKVNGVNGIVDAQINVDARLRYFAPVFGSDGTVYFGGMSKSGKGFYAVDAGLNAQEWIYKGGTDFNSTPAIADDGTIYVGCTDGYISALNPDGTEKWTSEYGSWTASAIAIGPDGTVYFSGENLNGGIFIAYNPADGTEKWRKQLDEKATYGGPAIGPDGTIYLGSSTEKMIAYNADGTEKWTYTAKGEIQTVPAIGDDGNIYFGDANGFFHIVDPVGKNLWKTIKLGDGIDSSVAIGQNGIIYVAVKVGETAKVIALKTNCTGLADGGWPMYAKNAKHTGR